MTKPKQTKIEQVVNYLQNNPDANANQVSTALKMPIWPSQISTARKKLKQVPRGPRAGSPTTGVKKQKIAITNHELCSRLLKLSSRAGGLGRLQKVISVLVQLEEK